MSFAQIECVEFVRKKIQFCMKPLVFGKCVEFVGNLALK